MVQWINILRNSSFVNPSRLSFLRKKTGAVALVQPGLTAGSQADEMLLHLENFKIIYWTKYWKFIAVQKEKSTV